MYQADGSETIAASSYNWCNDALNRDNSGEWKNHTTNFATSSDTAYIEVRFEMIGKTQGAEFLFDNVVLTKLGTSDDPNLDFEAGIAGGNVLNWVGYDSPDWFASNYTMSLAEGEGPDGTNAMKITAKNDSEGSYVVYSLRLDVEPSMVYNLNFDGKYQGTDIGVVPLIRMYQEDGSETVVASSYNWCIDPLSKDNSNTWKKHNTNFTTSSDTACIEVRFEMKGPKAGDTAWFDNIKITKVGTNDDLNLDFETGADVLGVFAWYEKEIMSLNSYGLSPDYDIWNRSMRFQGEAR